MASSRDRITYAPEYQVLDKALEDGTGVRLKFTEHGEAVHYRLRLHSARRADRQSNRETYEPGDDMYGKSVYDPLVVRLKEINGSTYLYVMLPKVGHIETLSDLEEAQSDTAEELKPAVARRF